MAGWVVQVLVVGPHVHVALRSPGGVEQRPYLGALIVGAEDWPALRDVLATLPDVELDTINDPGALR